MVLREVPDGCTVVGIPGTVVRVNGSPTSEMDQVDMPDPIAVELECLRRPGRGTGRADSERIRTGSNQEVQPELSV